MSTQYELLNVYHINLGPSIEARCIREAKAVIEQYDHLDRERFEMLSIFEDDCFKPFLVKPSSPEAHAYIEYVAKHGHAHDETILICTIWIRALASNDASKYRRIIKKFADIIANGI